MRAKQEQEQKQQLEQEKLVVGGQGQNPIQLIQVCLHNQLPTRLLH